MASLDSIQPDKHQKAILGWTTERDMVVTGVAGSGKSYLLLKKAKQVSTETDSYAIVVYTKSLKEFFVDELSEIDPSGKHVFYYQEWKQYYSLHPHEAHYDYLFIDECQDFGAADIANFKSVGKYCWFFGDSDQTIMDFPDHPTQKVKNTANQLGIPQPRNLAINHRLTIENARVGEQILSNHLSEACYKHGPKPVIVRVASADQELEYIAQMINSGNYPDIGILAYYNGNKGHQGSSVQRICDFLKSRGIPFLYKTHDHMTLDFKSNLPKIITFHCAKGLQFETVIIPFNDNRFYWEKNAFYVATTRPLTSLFLTYVNNLTFVNKASAIFQSNESVIGSDDLPF